MGGPSTRPLQLSPEFGVAQAAALQQRLTNRSCFSTFSKLRSASRASRGSNYSMYSSPFLGSTCNDDSSYRRDLSDLFAADPRGSAHSGSRTSSQRHGSGRALPSVVEQ